MTNENSQKIIDIISLPSKAYKHASRAPPKETENTSSDIEGRMDMNCFLQTLNAA